MQNKNPNNKLFTSATIFGLAGFILMFGVIFSHKHINTQFALLENQKAEAVIALESESRELEPLPDEILEEIIQSKINIMGLKTYEKYTQTLSPAMKFLRDITADVFLTQK